MEERTLKALKESIAKWEDNLIAANNRDFNGMRLVWDTCPLCEVFVKNAGLKEHCSGCPVFAVTGEPYCDETPYGSVVKAYSAQSINIAKCCQDELDFLKSLLPAGEQK